MSCASIWKSTLDPGHHGRVVGSGSHLMMASASSESAFGERQTSVEETVSSLLGAHMRRLSEQLAEQQGLAERRHQELLVRFQEVCKPMVAEQCWQQMHVSGPSQATGKHGTGPERHHRSQIAEPSSIVPNDAQIAELPTARLSPDADEATKSRCKELRSTMDQRVPTALDAEKTPSDKKKRVPKHNVPEKLDTFVRGTWLDMLSGFLIVTNMVCLFAELQLKGTMKLAYDLELTDSQGDWDSLEKIFDNLEYVFAVSYAAEIVMRIIVFRGDYFKACINLFDFVIVSIACLSVFILNQTSTELIPGVGLARIAKLLELLRAVKMVKFMNAFTEFRILLKTIAISAWSLLWSMILIGVIIVISGIFMFQISTQIIEDAGADMELRLWMYEYFGTAAKSSYTLFEATFSSGWTVKADYLVSNVNPIFAAFWIFYVVIVNFAMMRVVAALFLKQTMQVAAVDADRQALEQLKHRERYATMLEEIFQRGDTSGDGAISAAEFCVMIEDEAILGIFDRMDIELPEIKMLFAVLCDEDGLADYEEFLQGALKLKNSARCIDMIQVLHQLGKIKQSVSNHRHELGSIIEKALQKLDNVCDGFPHPSGRAVGPES